MKLNGTMLTIQFVPTAGLFCEMINRGNTFCIDDIKQRFDRSMLPKYVEISGSIIKTASILIPFVFHENNLVLLFTHRSNHLKNHRGQVSFPGGMREEVDHNLVQTALRETREEIGISPKQVEVFGVLDPLIALTGYRIFPFVGFIKNLDGIQKNTDEVEKIFCIPLKWLMDSENLYQEDYQSSNGILRKVWVYKDYEGERVWGITAEIMRQLIMKLK